ncbi:flagellar hook-associated protein FlgK [Ramlibacter sp. AW1]|uniref:Flagellar hook-associated protein 1 n=1 Tax=Ramlibacter aurantiacus TaxID=2801330 RepID=A0A936ZTS1_9BURK|nr:flagellar hook-associated protein FlgK [Ramlibacter aurantiacus]MBL0423333.1 flagellar hook-associated protein FlgK [Ramlibacter aurantiacus]
MTTSLLQIGVRGLTAAQGALATTSHNIANVNTAGYVRQEAVMATAGGLSTGAGFFGGGVDVATVRRHYDQFLAGSLQALGSQRAADAARSDGLAQLDALFADPELGIGAGIDRVFAALGDMASRPADTAARQAVLGAVDELARRFNAMGTQIDQLSAQADARLSLEAGQVNEQLSQLQRLNEAIVRAQASGHAPNDLLDQREQALQQLGKLMAIRTVDAGDGATNVFSADGQPLLVGQQAARLAAVSDGTRLVLQLSAAGAVHTLDADALGGGSLAGTLRLRDQDLAGAGAELGRLARAVTDALNAQQALGVDARGNPGAPLLAMDSGATSLRALPLSPAQLATGYAAVAQPAQANAGSARVAAFDVVRAGPENTTPVGIAFADPPTSFTLTGVPGGPLTLPYQSGQPIPPAPADYNGWRLVLQGTPAAGDRFEVDRSPNPGADNRNALALGRLANQGLVDGGSLNQGYASLLAKVGTRVQAARGAADLSARMEGEARASRERVSGVNLDEEAANLLRYQQAYQACARVIQASQALFDSLLAASGR